MNTTLKMNIANPDLGLALFVSAENETLSCALEEREWEFHRLE